MPYVENPTDQDLLCAAAGKIIPARSEIEVTDAEAAEVPEHVFIVKAEPVAPSSEEPAAVPVELDPTVAAEVVAAANQIEAAQAAVEGASA